MKERKSGPRDLRRRCGGSKKYGEAIRVLKERGALEGACTRS